MFWLENDAVKPYVKAVITCVRQEKFLPSFFKLSHFSKNTVLYLYMWDWQCESVGRSFVGVEPYSQMTFDAPGRLKSPKRPQSRQSHFFGFFRSWLPQHTTAVVAAPPLLLEWPRHHYCRSGSTKPFGDAQHTHAYINTHKQIRNDAPPLLP